MLSLREKINQAKSKLKNPPSITCLYCDRDRYWSGLCLNHFNMWQKIYNHEISNKTIFGYNNPLMDDYIRLLKKYELERYAEIMTKINIIDFIK